MRLHHRNLSILFITVTTLLVVACSDAKKIQKAQQRVLTNAESFNAVGAIWARLNPCIIDSVIKMTSNETIKTDTFYKHGAVSFAPVDHDTIIIHRNINRYDTARVYIRDKRFENILIDTINFYKLANSRSQTAAEIAKQEANKRSKLIIMWIIILVAENIAIIVYKVRGL